MRLSVVALPKPNRQRKLSLYLRISHGAGTKRHVALGFRVHRDDWNGRKGEVRRSAQGGHHLNQILADRLADARRAVRDLLAGSRHVDPDRADVEAEMRSAFGGRA